MASGIEIGTLIDRDSAIRGGRPKIAGTGLTVRRIVGWYKMGMTPEEIALEISAFDPRPGARRIGVLSRNREEIEADIAQEDVATAHWEHQLAKNPNGQ
jgi:hypothetical protein